MGCGSSNQNSNHVARNQPRQPAVAVNVAQQQQLQQQQQQQLHQQQLMLQQQQQQQQQMQAQQMKQPTKAALEKGNLLRYVEIEKEVNRLEAMNVVHHLQMKWDELKSLEENIRRLTAIFQSCREQALKEKKDVDSIKEPGVRGFFADQTSFDAKLSKEQEDLLSALNKQEVAQKELENSVTQRDAARIVVKDLHTQAENLQKLYKEQDQILAAIFDGKYGSDLEYRLEHEHDVTCEKQQRISAAKARWQAGRLLVQHAHSQLGYAVQRWDYICRIPVEISGDAFLKLLGNPSLESLDLNLRRLQYIYRNTQMRYSIATEVRNYLIAASTNLRNSQGYLRGIEFPYCKVDEVNTLERATSNIYADLPSNDRHQHAMNVYRSIFQRSHALLQWFDLVIDKTIDRDMKNATEELFAKKRELRVERVNLIKVKLVEFFGPEEAAAAGLDADGNLTDARRLQEQLSKVNEEELKKQLENVKVFHPEKVQHQDNPTELASGGDGRGADASVSASAAADAGSVPPPPKPEEGGEGDKAPKPDVVPLKELAPPPSQDQLFGDIDSIKKQYEIDMEEFQRAQDVNRARVEQGLQEKLAARKTRKARILTQQEQTDKLLQESAGA